jgi:hypothetical protein
VSPVTYELGFYIPEDAILHSHRRENLISYEFYPVSTLAKFWDKLIAHFLLRRSGPHGKRRLQQSSVSTKADLLS